MNNKTATMIRDFGMARVFDGIDFSELIQIDSGKFVLPINTDEGDFFCEVDFVAKKEDYSPERDVRLYAEKLAKAKASADEKAKKKAEREAKKKAPKTE
jgi:hypothetical protein